MTTPVSESLRSDLISLIQRGPKTLMDRVDKASAPGWQFDTYQEEGENGPYVDMTLYYRGQQLGVLEMSVSESGELEFITDFSSTVKTMDAEILQLFAQGVRQALILDNAFQADRLAFLNKVREEIEPAVAMSPEDLGANLAEIDAQTSHSGQDFTGLLISPSVVASFQMSHRTGKDYGILRFEGRNPQDPTMTVPLGDVWTDLRDEGSFSVSGGADPDQMRKMASLAINMVLPMIELKQDRPQAEKEAEIRSALEAGLGF